jgi:hypothetical protein
MPEDASSRCSTAATKAAGDDAEGSYLSANTEEKGELFDLDDLEGTVVSVQSLGQIKEIESLKKSVYKVLAFDANHKVVIVEAWGAKNAAFLEQLLKYVCIANSFTKLNYNTVMFVIIGGCVRRSVELFLLSSLR